VGLRLICNSPTETELAQAKSTTSERAEHDRPWRARESSQAADGILG
jgi:hypothetical protein